MEGDATGVFGEELEELQPREEAGLVEVCGVPPESGEVEAPGECGEEFADIIN